MTTSMSEPVLLVINSDQCSHCKVLLEKKDSITKAINAKFPKLLNIWVSLDKFKLPAIPHISIPHLPIIFYFPQGAWGKYITGDYSCKISVMSNETITLGVKYDVDKITQWLEKVIQPEDRAEVHDNWSYDNRSYDFPVIDNSQNKHSNLIQQTVKNIVVEEIQKYMMEKYDENKSERRAASARRYKCSERSRSSKSRARESHSKYDENDGNAGFTTKIGETDISFKIDHETNNMLLCAGNSAGKTNISVNGVVVVNGLLGLLGLRCQ